MAPSMPAAHSAHVFIRSKNSHYIADKPEGRGKEPQIKKQRTATLQAYQQPPIDSMQLLTKIQGV
jgi:hypothetical protein